MSICFLSYYGATKEEQALVEAIDNKDNATVNSALDKIRGSFYSELHSDAICTTSLPPFLLIFTSCWLYATMLSKMAEYLEKSGEYERANEVLECLLCQGVVCRGSRGRWYERLALNCDYHLKNKEKVGPFSLSPISSYSSKIRPALCPCNSSFCVST